MKGKWEADVLWAMAWLDMTREDAENYIAMYRASHHHPDGH